MGCLTFNCLVDFLFFSQNLKVWKPPTPLFSKVVMVIVGLGLRFCMQNDQKPHTPYMCINFAFLIGFLYFLEHRCKRRFYDVRNL
jgi:hypothetical protein